MAQNTINKNDGNFFSPENNIYWKFMMSEGLKIQKPVLELFYSENDKVLRSLAIAYYFVVLKFAFEILFYGSFGILM